LTFRRRSFLPFPGSNFEAGRFCAEPAGRKAETSGFADWKRQDGHRPPL